MKYSSTIIEFAQILFGVFLASIGLKAFLLPNGFLDGGVTGIALLLNILTEVNVSVLLVAMSIPFLIMAYFTLSKRIMLKSIVSILLLAFSIQLESFETITDDKLLISIFGGIFMGLGIGITVRNGAVLDGSEILGIYINDRFGIGIGKVILFFNVVLFGITAVVVSTEIALYSILTYIVTAKVTDFVVEGFEDFIGVMIVSEHSDQIEKSILHDLGAGMTIYQGAKGFGSKGVRSDFNIIHTVVNRIDIRKIHRVVDDIDENAFVVEYDINSIKGGVLRRYLERKKQQKQLSPALLTDF
ncbi:MAG: YitT family protein [Bacteroidota bacterium]